jgi:hypothetical protein
MARYVGLYVHKRTITACLLDGEGQPVRRATFDCTRTAIAQFAKEQLEHSDVVALEATTNNWALAEILEPYVARVVVSNPLKTKATASPPSRRTRLTRRRWRNCFAWASCLKSGTRAGHFNCFGS